MSIDASPYVPVMVWTNGTTAGRDDCTHTLPPAILPTAVLNFDAVPHVHRNVCEVMNRGHMALTPLILTQPSGQQETAAVGGQNGSGLEEMDMER
jgi:hypothetical protein